MAVPLDKPSLRLRVTATAESMLRNGHPWLFANSVRKQNRDGETGELAVIFDRKDKFLAIGFFDADSPIRVRVLHAGKPCAIDGDWWRKRAADAIGRRDGLFDSQTKGYRLINGESDGWPGLVLDRYGDTRVMKIYTAAWLPRLDEIADVLAADTDTRLVLRLSRNVQDKAEQFGFSDGQVLRGSPLGRNSTLLPFPAFRFPRPTKRGEGQGEGSSFSAQCQDAPSPLEGPVVFLENGLRFEADVLRGQKTGFFLDQRENRREVGALSAGRTVLNVFSYTGGFSLYAAAGGAASVLSLDISEHALAGCRRNFSLNQDRPDVARCRHETIRADAFNWLAGEPKAQFDLIVLDPPSLAKRESERAAAIGAYAKLLEGAVSRLTKNGILVAASCSAHISADEFFGLARKIAIAPGMEELKTTRHPVDHPASFPEAEYLKCIYLRLRG